jgi:hypothetical protein
MAMRVCAGLGSCSRPATRQNSESSANCWWRSWTRVKKAWAPLPFAGFTLFGFEFDPAERVNPVVLDSYAIFTGGSIEGAMEEFGWKVSQQFALQVELLQALARRPFERREEQPVRPAQRVKMCGSEGGGSLGVPRGGAGGRIEGISQVAQQWTSAHEFIRKRWAAKQPTGPSIETTTPDCRGFIGAGDQLAHAVRGRANTDEEQFGQRGESFVIWAFRTKHWICVLVSVSADRAAISKQRRPSQKFENSGGSCGSTAVVVRLACQH